MYFISTKISTLPKIKVTFGNEMLIVSVFCEEHDVNKDWRRCSCVVRVYATHDRLK